MIRRPRYQDSGGSKLLFFCEIALISASFYAAGLIDLDTDPLLYFLYEGGLERVLFVGASIVVAMYFHHLYSDIRVRSRVVLLQQLCEVFGIALVGQSLVAYIRQDGILPRWLMIYGALFSLLAIFAWRVFYSQVVLNIIRRHRILFVGHSATIQEIAKEISNSPGRGYEVVGFVDDREGDSDIGKWLGRFDSLAVLGRHLKPDRIVVAMGEGSSLLPLGDLLDLHYAGMTIEEAGQTYETVHQRLSSRDLNLRELVFSQELSPPASRISLQLYLDRIVGTIILILSLPLILIILAGLRLTSRDAVLLRFPRSGYNGKEFQQFRFRRAASSASLYSRLHLDALPQLINVIRGEMALVGPRAETPHVRDLRTLEMPLYDYRLNVPPGVTGWAQINLGPHEQESKPLLALEYDLYYIKHISQTLNFYILMTTLKNRLIWADRE